MTARTRRLWEERVLDPAGPWHDLTFEIDLTGPVELERLRTAIDAMPVRALPTETAAPEVAVSADRLTVTLPALWGTPGEFTEALAARYAGRPLTGQPQTATDDPYWDELLDGLPDLRFPTDQPSRTSGQAGTGTVAHRPGRHTPDLVLAALTVVLWRWTRRTDLAVGIPEGILRVDLDPDADLPAVAEQIRRRRADAARHAGQFQQAAEDRGIRHLPAVSFWGDPIPETRIPAGESGELVLAPRIVHGGAVGSVLTLGVDHAAYDARVLKAATVERFLAHLERVLEADQGLPVRRIPLMGEEERSTVLDRFSRTAPAAGQDCALHETVSGPADATAVVCGAERLTYGELERRSSVLARHLLDRGTRPGQIVGVSLPRSVELIVAYLGVLKAGAAYLPLDPGYPAERLDYMRADAGAELVVTRDLLDSLADGPALERPVPVGPDQLAYVIYTSGSTGRPKGVQVEHRQIVHSTAARYTVFPGPYTSYLALAGPSFDALGAGIYLVLSRGGTLVLPTDQEVSDPWLLAELTKRERVTHFDGVPAQYAAVLDADPGAFADLRCAVVAGEACPPGLPERHYQVTGDATLINEYGPTETTVWAVGYTCDREQLPYGSVPIGRPVAGAVARVVDEALLPVPIGVPGELCIGGSGVAVRGYLNRPDTTAERFVSNPFGEGVIYRTGDLVRWLEDGNLEFLGRIDQQVKVRGYRVEPSEIEAVLLSHPLVREAAVLTQQTGGHNRLVAYFTVSGGAELDEAELSVHAGERLPDYMLPAVWMKQERMPRTRNGKLDRSALPVPSPRRTKPTAARTSDLHEAVREIFAALSADDRHQPETVPAWAGGYYGPALVTSLLRSRFGERVPPAAVGLGIGRIAADLRRLGATPTHV